MKLQTLNRAAAASAFLFATMSALSATAQMTAATAQNNYIIGKQESTSRKLWIHTSVPSGCRYAITNAGATWTAASPNVRHVWSGYASYYSYNWNADPAVQISQPTASNTADNQTEVGWMYNANALAESYTLTRNASSTPPLWRDGDVIVNNQKLNIMYCNTGIPPAGQYDFESIILHEFGHNWGLGHDLGDTTGATVMYQYGKPGKNSRVLTARDTARAELIYGKKP